jgi:hypothetical protein
LNEKTYLSDILVADLADLLNVGGALRDLFQVVASQDELILLSRRDGSVNTLGHDDAADNLLSNKVADFDLPQTSLLALVQVDVDGKMGIDVAHLVLESLCDASNHVLDDGADSAESSDLLAVAMVNLNRDDVLLGVAEVDSKVAEVLDELAYNSSKVRISSSMTAVKNKIRSS